MLKGTSVALTRALTRSLWLHPDFELDPDGFKAEALVCTSGTFPFRLFFPNYNLKDRPRTQHALRPPCRSAAPRRADGKSSVLSGGDGKLHLFVSSRARRPRRGDTASHGGFRLLTEDLIGNIDARPNAREPRSRGAFCKRAKRFPSSITRGCVSEEVVEGRAAGVNPSAAGGDESMG